jgi:hypothetical protein
LILNPDTASKHKKVHLKFRTCSAYAPQKIKVSSANNK